jgi:hypothetical protein
MGKTAVLATKGLWSKRPFPPQKVYAANGRSRHERSMQQTAVLTKKVCAENGRSRHKKSMQETAVPATKGLCSKRPFFTIRKFPFTTAVAVSVYRVEKRPFSVNNYHL